MPVFLHGESHGQTQQVQPIHGRAPDVVLDCLPGRASLEGRANNKDLG